MNVSNQDSNREDRENRNIGRTWPDLFADFVLAKVIPFWVLAVAAALSAFMIIYSAFFAQRSFRLAGFEFGPTDSSSILYSSDEIAAWGNVDGSGFAGKNIMNTTQPSPGVFVVTFKRRVAWPFTLILSGRSATTKILEQNQLGFTVETWSRPELENSSVPEKPKLETARFQFVVFHKPETIDGSSFIAEP